MLKQLTPDEGLATAGLGDWVQLKANGPFIIHIKGTGVATATVQGAALPSYNGDTFVGKALFTAQVLASGDFVFEVPAPYNYVRVDVTAHTSGVVHAFAYGQVGN